MVDVAVALMPRSCLIFISIRKGRQGGGEERQREDRLSAHLLHKWRDTVNWLGFVKMYKRKSATGTTQLISVTLSSFSTGL